MSKQQGILFKPDMVRAILEGRKTQTRRGIPEEAMFVASSYIEQGCEQVSGRDENGRAVISFNTPSGQSHVLFGKWAKGDYLYVKETWWSFGYFFTTRETTKTGKLKENWLREPDIHFVADHEDGWEPPKKGAYALGWWRKMSSLFLSKEYARIWLKVTNVRVERLLDISDSDAIAEGVLRYNYWTADGQPQQYSWENYAKGDVQRLRNPRESYFSLWDSINGAGSHERNPWVWVIEFERVEKPN